MINQKLKDDIAYCIDMVRDSYKNANYCRIPLMAGVNSVEDITDTMRVFQDEGFICTYNPGDLEYHPNKLPNLPMITVEW